MKRYSILIISILILICCFVSRAGTQSGFNANSVLATGSWFKFSITADGVYRLTYDDLNKAGIPVSTLDPRNIRIYGNGGGMLPESNDSSRIDDLIENAIYVYGQEDGKFDPGDYILFYGTGPDRWKYSPTDKVFHHVRNIYSDVSCYFLNYDLGPGKRIPTQSFSSQPASQTYSDFNDFIAYDRDDINLIKSGRVWYDQEIFDVTTTRNYSFTFPNLETQSPVVIALDAAARSLGLATSFDVKANGKALMSVSIDATTSTFDDPYGFTGHVSASYAASGPTIGLTLNYNQTVSGAVGYLNYFELNAVRSLVMNGSQMGFRNASSAQTGRISEFHLTSQGSPLTIWDVTLPYNVRNLETQISGNQYSIRMATDSLREFFAYDGTTFGSPTFVGKVANQNLHALDGNDYIIVTYPDFQDQAERLAQFHRANSGLNVYVTTPDKIYNEFSSGVQDITAIRDFMRMLWERKSQANHLKYLLLLGDASYDYKNRVPNNTNFVPSYQVWESLDPVASYVTDDYYGILKHGSNQDTLYIGIGRFPVRSVADAASAVDKVIHYSSNSDSVKTDWRNIITFVADDQDNGGLDGFMEDSEVLAGEINKYYNIDKIYLDAYVQISTPGGARYPEVNDAINQRIAKGTLVINYVGHGGELGWAHERVLEDPDIQNWTNYNKLPVFVTATCEFSRMDDPSVVSAGELVFLNPHGGGIALFTTTRATFAGGNLDVTSRFYSHLFEMVNGQHHRMGDLFRLSKTSADDNTRKFVLLGDPALMMAYPDLNVVTTSIKTGSPLIENDTLKALTLVTIEGEVRDGGVLASGFNGIVFPTIFDKTTEITTLANDHLAPPFNFYLQKNVIYSGQSKVTNGTFSFSFIVPKDINYTFGLGRISYYARSSETDANGYDENLVVGGYDNKALPDTSGPALALYMNDRNFVSGGITNQNPAMLADVSDESGINTVGNGIGHDITAILDNDSKDPLILNDYYTTELDTYQKGVILYPFFNLSDGSHHVDLKVWDVFNNSTEAGIDFVVASTEEFALQEIMNYPNPFRDHTTFSFETNQADHNLDIELKIYSIYGSLLKTFRTTVYANGYRLEPFQWDGTSDSGSLLGSGTYVYNLKISLPDGTVAAKSSKLVFIR